MEWKLILVFLTIYVYRDANSVSDNQLDLIRQQKALDKFKRQLLSSLHLTEIVDKSTDLIPRKKWLKIPKSVRKRLESTNSYNRKTVLELKQLFIPVNNMEKCRSNLNKSDRFCIRFVIGEINVKQKISSALLFVTSSHPMPRATHFKLRSLMSNKTLEFRYPKRNLKVDLNSIIEKHNEFAFDTKQEFEIVCLRKCPASLHNNIKMIIEITLKPKDVIIRKSRSETMCLGNEIFCCKRTFQVRPCDIGLNRIVHPDTFNLNYCSGECNNYVKTNGYRKVISILRKSKKANLSPLQLESMKSCCAPEEYDALELIYMTNNNNSFQKAILPDLLISNCACI